MADETQKEREEQHAETPEMEAAGSPPAAESAAQEGSDADKPDAAPPPKAPPKTPASSDKAAPEVSRRGFFSWAAVGWVGFTAAIGACVTTFNRFMFPNVLYEPPTTFRVGPPGEFGLGVVDERFKESNGVWIVNAEGTLYALIAICTHLGCPPNWLEAQNKFKCPCHGSGYYKSGVNFEGPTPRPLERAKIFIDPDDGQVVVDKSQKYQWELGQWDDPDSFVTLS